MSILHKLKGRRFKCMIWTRGPFLVSGSCLPLHNRRSFLIRPLMWTFQSFPTKSSMIWNNKIKFQNHDKINGGTFMVDDPVQAAVLKAIGELCQL